MTPSQARPAAAAASASKPPFPLAAQLFRLRALIVLFLLTVSFAAMSSSFLTGANLTILVKHVAINAILAVGMTFVILSGGIDLSVGSVCGLAGIIAGGLIHHGLVLRSLGVVVYFHTWLVIAVAILAGALAGAFNGALIAYLRVAPFIATLGSMYAARGAALLISNGATFPDLQGKPDLGNTGFLWLGAGSVWGLPVPILLMIAIRDSLCSSRNERLSGGGCIPWAGTSAPPNSRACACPKSSSWSISSRAFVRRSWA